MEFAGMRMQLCGRGCKYIHIHTPLVFIIRSYSDKTFFLLYVTVMNIAVRMLVSCSYMWSK